MRTRSTRIAGASIEIGGDDLVIEFTGGPVGDVLVDPCNTQYELEVDDETTPATFTIWHLEPTVRPKPLGLGDIAYSCTDVGYQRELRYPLTAATFADQIPSEIIDGSHGDTVPVIQITDLLAPTALPDGWEVYDTGAPFEPVSRTTALRNDTSSVFLRTTLVADPDAALERFRDGSPEPQPVELRGDDPLNPTVVPLPPLTFDGTVEDILIRNGTSALLETTSEQRRLRFVHGSYLYELSATLDVAAPLLISFAEGLN